jgi:hypothetical protein
MLRGCPKLFKTHKGEKQMEKFTSLSKPVQVLIVAIAITLNMLPLCFSLPPTLSEATTQILSTHPECADNLSVEQLLVEGVYTGPIIVPDRYVRVLVCDLADVSIRIR